MPKPRRRRVLVSTRAHCKGRPRLFAFGYPDFAALVGRSEAAIRQVVRRGHLDPTDLASIVAFAQRCAREDQS